jgi:hypothetical protein
MDYYLVDATADTYYPKTPGSTLLYSPAASRKFIMWIKGAWNAVNATRADDLLLCYLDIQAVLCRWMARLTLRHRNIVAINLLLKDKDTAKNRVATLLYRSALASAHFHATITAPEYGEMLNRKFGREFHYHHLPDLYIYDDLSERYASVKTQSNTVFCGGHNGRDWATMLRIAQAMPDVTFKLVMPGDVYNDLHNLPANVVALHDISLDTFLTEMAASSTVALPLDTEAPAGLIVMFQAAALGKPVVTTSTVTTRGYISPDMPDATLVADISTEAWSTTIRSALATPRQQCGSFRRYLQENCSAEKYVAGLQNIIRAVKQ